MRVHQAGGFLMQARGADVDDWSWGRTRRRLGLLWRLTLPYRGRTFHLATCSYAFANFPDPLKVLRELARVIRRDGRIAIIDLVAPEESARRDLLCRLETLRGRLPARIRSRSERVLTVGVMPAGNPLTTSSN